MKKIILIVIALMTFPISQMAQLNQCQVSGTIFEPTGEPAASGKYRFMIREVTRNDSLVYYGPIFVFNQADGLIQFNLPRSSNAFIQGPVNAFRNGAYVDIPDAATARLEDLMPLSQNPAAPPALAANKADSLRSADGTFDVDNFLDANGKIDTTSSAVSASDWQTFIENMGLTIDFSDSSRAASVADTSLVAGVADSAKDVAAGDITGTLQDAQITNVLTSDTLKNDNHIIVSIDHDNNSISRVFKIIANNSTEIAQFTELGALEMFNQGVIKLRELSEHGTSSISIRAPDSLDSGFFLELPEDNGDANQFLQTNGGGTLSWATPAGGGDFLAADFADSLDAQFDWRGTIGSPSAGDSLWGIQNGQLVFLDVGDLPGGVSGDITAVGPMFSSGAAFTDGVTTSGTEFLVIEGVTDNTSEYHFAVTSADPGSDFTFTFPDATGEVSLLGQTIESGEITDGTVALGDVAFDPIVETELDSESELETQLTDVTDVFTNNDGALADDDLSDDALDALQNVAALTEAQGDVLYFDGSNWNRLAAGTSGDFLQTQGAGANPQWATPAGSGDITDVGPMFSSGAAFTDGVTTSGTEFLVIEGVTDNTSEYHFAVTSADPGSDFTFTFPDATGEVSLLGQTIESAEITDGTVALGDVAFDPIVETELDSESELETQLTDVTDVFTNNDGALADDDLSDDALDALQNVAALTEAQGDVLYFDGSNWNRLAAGTSGDFLQTQGAGANPQWATPAGSGDITDVGPMFSSGAAFTDGVTTSGTEFLVIEGVTDNTSEYHFAVTSADPGSDFTFTFPDATGEVSLLGQTIEIGEVAFDPIVETELDSESELETQLTDVTDVFTNNDGALADDDLSDDALDALQNVAALTEAQGDVLYFDGSNWNRLAAGTTGDFLQTQGAGANPQWATPAGSGDITDVGPMFSTGAAFTDGVTTSGTEFLVIEGVTDNTSEYHFAVTSADPGSDFTFTFPDATGEVSLLGQTIEIGEVAFDPIVETELDSESELETQLTDVTDVFTNNDGALADDDLSDDALDALQNVAALTEAQGDVLYFDGSNWNRLAAGTDGQLLETNGAGANPQWSSTSTLTVEQTIQFTPNQARVTGTWVTNSARIDNGNPAPRLLFSGTQTESAVWYAQLPSNYVASSLGARITYTMSSATTGDVDAEIEVFGVSDGDATDLDGAWGGAAVNEIAGGTTVPGTAGNPDQIDISLSNDDSAAANDWVAIRMNRDHDDADDDASGDMEVRTLTIYFNVSLN